MDSWESLCLELRLHRFLWSLRSGSTCLIAAVVLPLCLVGLRAMARTLQVERSSSEVTEGLVDVLVFGWSG